MNITFDKLKFKLDKLNYDTDKEQEDYYEKCYLILGEDGLKKTQLDEVKDQVHVWFSRNYVVEKYILPILFTLTLLLFLTNISVLPIISIFVFFVMFFSGLYTRHKLKKVKESYNFLLLFFDSIDV
jgi:hypothetical protein